MENLSFEFALGRLKWVLIWTPDVKDEDSSLVWALCLYLDLRLEHSDIFFVALYENRIGLAVFSDIFDLFLESLHCSIGESTDHFVTIINIST